MLSWKDVPDSGLLKSKTELRRFSLPSGSVSATAPQCRRRVWWVSRFPECLTFPVQPWRRTRSRHGGSKVSWLTQRAISSKADPSAQSSKHSTRTTRIASNRLRRRLATSSKKPKSTSTTPSPFETGRRLPNTNASRLPDRLKPNNASCDGSVSPPKTPPH